MDNNESNNNNNNNNSNHIDRVVPKLYQREGQPHKTEN